MEETLAVVFEVAEDVFAVDFEVVDEVFAVVFEVEVEDLVLLIVEVTSFAVLVDFTLDVVEDFLVVELDATSTSAEGTH